MTIDIEIVTAVLPHILLCPGPSTFEDLDALYEQGCHWLIDCRAEFNDAPLLAKHPDVAYLWNPTNDDGQPKPPSYFELGYMFARPHIVAGQSGGPHCAAEVNRGPSEAYYLLRRHWLLSPEDAEKAIRDVRPQVGIAYKTSADAAFLIYNDRGNEVL